MTSNPYDPVTTVDTTQLADDDWNLTLPPIRYNRYTGTSRWVNARITQPNCNK